MSQKIIRIADRCQNNFKIRNHFYYKFCKTQKILLLILYEVANKKVFTIEKKKN